MISYANHDDHGDFCDSCQGTKVKVVRVAVQWLHMLMWSAAS